MMKCEISDQKAVMWTVVSALIVYKRQSSLAVSKSSNMHTLIVIAATISMTLSAIAVDPLDWWQKTVFYQIYPRSFMDSDGNGVGDLNGITQRLDHLKDAGIGAVWLSPIFKSPMKDFGYDIANFTEIDETFGTMDDFIALQTRAKELGILSAFGGSAWEWREERQQYYLHQFVVEQPDLNYNNPYVNVLRFWMDKGVDGFRVDAVPYLFEDPLLTDEPESGSPGALPNETNYLNHIYTQNLPGTYDMVQQWREVVDQKKSEDGVTRVLMLETYASLEQVMQYYGTEERPGGHFPFNFLLITDLNNESKAEDFNNVIHKWIDNMPEGRWANWVIGNHDQHRVASRYGPELTDGLNMLAQFLPGAGVTYNGEEIGMIDTFITYEETVDPWGVNAGPERYDLFSRDPERTPFQWDDSTNAGFSAGEDTWLPVNSNYKELNLKNEKEAANSHYKIYQQLTKARNEPAVQSGNLQTAVLSENVFAFSRELDGNSPFVVIINLGSAEETVSLDVSPISKASLVLDPKESLVLTS
ncbi:Maltase 1 [Blattella germanica]|nr:Maltase 1 [Blattella germanica]